MVRLFCDCCGRELLDASEIGNFKIQEKSSAFIKHQKQEQIRGQEFLFCVECARKIRDYFQGLKGGEEIANSGDTK